MASPSRVAVRGVRVNETKLSTFFVLKIGGLGRRSRLGGPHGTNKYFLDVCLILNSIYIESRQSFIINFVKIAY